MASFLSATATFATSASFFRAAIRIAGPVIAVAHEDVSPRPVRVRILPDPVGWLRIGVGADIGQSDRPGRRIAPSTRMLAENALPPVKAAAEIGEIGNRSSRTRA
ncbi:hypothetical protein N181_18205 [Sinorhizobium fredii USDA 205]|nr:hypothetical protein N181_18205 [Sinorhizobium fredii USDA 205]MCG5474465.1 hypothetical protein [Sinorhizobium fredii]GEC31983.1 hypothetical protein EFR01_21540 [Sinorhizobium fredii]GLS08024.1 hypothetical protein GCM10007864_16520 [Sinorhizobium fredii]